MKLEGNTLKVPNRSELRGSTLTPKEVLQKMYLDTIGKYILVGDEKRLVQAVEIDDDWITLTLN